MVSFDALAFIAAFLPLFVIVDPVLAIPFFYSLTAKYKPEHRRALAFEASVVALVILLFFALVGQAFLSLLNISMGSFRIAGGLLLLYLAFEMFTGALPKTRAPAADGVGAVPFGTPLLAGPGAISSAVLLMNTPGIGAFYVIPSIILVSALCFVVLSQSERIYKLLGKNDFIVLTRVMGLILAAIALEFVRRGLTDWTIIT